MCVSHIFFVADCAFQYVAMLLTTSPRSNGGVVYLTSFPHADASDCGRGRAGGDLPAVTIPSAPARAPVIRPANGTVLRCLLCAEYGQSPVPTHLSAA